jgi:hypothetical protein
MRSAIVSGLSIYSHSIARHSIVHGVQEPAFSCCSGAAWKRIPGLAGRFHTEGSFTNGRGDHEQGSEAIAERQPGAGVGLDEYAYEQRRFDFVLPISGLWCSVLVRSMFCFVKADGVLREEFRATRIDTLEG